MVALQIITLYRATPLVDLSCDNYVQFLLCSESCGIPPHRHRAGRTPEAAGRGGRAGRAGWCRSGGLGETAGLRAHAPASAVTAGGGGRLR